MFLSITIDKTTKQKGEKMKVSKIILASMLGAAILGSAGADEYDGPRNRCKAKTDWYWVENTKTCVPKNPCKDGDGKYEKYCIRAFKDVQTERLFEAVDLAGGYLDLKGKNKPSCSNSFTGEEVGLLGQDYISCITSDDEYFVFEFDDTENSELEITEVKEVLCVAAGGQVFDRECNGVDEEQCVKLRNTIRMVHKIESHRIFNNEIGEWVDDNYDLETKRCRMY